MQQQLVFLLLLLLLVLLLLLLLLLLHAAEVARDLGLQQRGVSRRKQLLQLHRDKRQQPL